MLTNRPRSFRPNLEILNERVVPSAFADFNRDGFGDLVISDQHAGDDEVSSSGAVHVIYGTAAGLDSNTIQVWSQDSFDILEVAESFDSFGSSLAVGDFNGDGFSDLAIGVPNEDILGVSDAGLVHIIYGSPEGLSPSGNQHWTQDSFGIGDVAETGDQFGSTLAAGDFNGDGRDDLAITAQYEDFELRSGGIIGAVGTVHTLYGSELGLTSVSSQIWSQDSTDILNSAEEGDQFGSSLAVGDFNGDGRDDLAVGTSFESLAAIASAGAVNVIYGSFNGLTANGNQFWTQNSPGIANAAESGDHFGATLAAGDFNGDGRDDLAIGVDHESIGTVYQAGAVHILYGRVGPQSGGLSSANNRIWHQNSYGIADICESRDHFGRSLASDDFNGDGRDDLAIGVPQETIGNITWAGAVQVLYGSAGGLSSANNQFFSQASPGIPGIPKKFDGFATSLATGDFNGDGKSDLSIGVFAEGESHVSFGTGAVHVLYGTPNRLKAVNNQFLSPVTFGIDGEAFGWNLAGS